MNRLRSRRAPSFHLAIVLTFVAGALAAACTVDTGDVESSGGTAGGGALSGTGATGGANATGGATGGANATGGSGGTAGSSASGGSSTGGRNMTGGSGGRAGAGGASAAGTGGMLSTGGTAGASGSGGGNATGGTGGQVPEEPYCAVTEDWDPDYAALEEEILVLVNEYRAQGANCGGREMPPAGPLTMDASLQCAARVHTKDMADRDFFDHDNPDGDGPSERMERAGYDGRGWGENIAAGRDTAEATMEQWMNSPGHCTNIMGDGYTLIGVGYYPGGEYGHLWTQTFGS